MAPSAQMQASHKISAKIGAGIDLNCGPQPTRAAAVRTSSAACAAAPRTILPTGAAALRASQVAQSVQMRATYQNRVSNRAPPGLNF